MRIPNDLPMELKLYYYYTTEDGNVRPMDKDEVDLTGGKVYLQMIKYMDIYKK
mgnify:CR=1 FL=1